MKKEIPIFIIAIVVVSSLTFFIGTKVSGSKNKIGNFNGGDLPNFNGGYGLQQTRKNGNLGTMVIGEVLSKDDNGVTIKLQNGGSKIVFISSTTTVSKSVSGNKDDITIGNTISVTGKTNTDGSTSATSIDIREKIKTE